jgi:outer membrane protein assembly factor BamA
MKLYLPIIGIWAALMLGDDIKAQETIATTTLIYSTEGTNITTDTTNARYLIKDIFIVGNKRTRKSTILRELSFRVADAYPLPEIISKLDETKRQLMNTGLFRNVVVYLRSLQDQSVFVNVEVVEKWYFYPQPFLRVANGTFSQWSEKGRQLDQLNYGIKLTQFNFSGRGDKMHLNLTNGYTKKIALQYQGFYFDKALKWSGSISIAHGKNRELNYATESNKLLSVKNPDGYLFEFSQLALDVTYRPVIKTRHNFSIGYNYNRIADTVNKLNAYYAPSEKIHRYPYISYGISFTDLNFNPYPTKGKAGDFSIQKAGITSSFNLWQFTVKGASYWPLSRKTYFNIKAGAVLKLPFRQPYITQQFLGYGDAYLQGYENYIVDGVAGGYLKATAAYNLFNIQIPLPQIKWLKTWSKMPVRVYVKTFANTGYAHNPNITLRNELTNKMLYSTGVGIDIIAFTDLIFKIEWSFNQLGQNALYLHQ